MLNEINAASSKTGPVNSDHDDVPLLLYRLLCCAVPFGPVLAAVLSAIIAYGAIASTIIGLLGTTLHPFSRLQ